MEIAFQAELWEWHGKGAWYLVTLPIEYSEQVKIFSTQPRKGFGSVRVEATIGKTIWKTSIFPDTKSSSYILPVKKDVRIKEKLEAGNSMPVLIRLFEL